MILVKIYDLLGFKENSPNSVKEITKKIIMIMLSYFIMSTFLLFVSLRYFGIDKIFSFVYSIGFSFLFFQIKKVTFSSYRSSPTLFLGIIISIIHGFLLSHCSMFLILKEEIQRDIFSYSYEFDLTRHTFFLKLETLNELMSSSPILIYVYFLLFLIFIALDFIPILMYSGEKQITKDIQELNFSNLNNQIEIFSSIQHELGNKLPATKQEIKFLLEIFEKRSISGEGVKISDKVRNPLPGEELYSIDSVKDLFVRSLNKLDYSLNVVSQLGDVLKADPTKIKLEPVDLIEFLESEVTKYPIPDNRVSIEVKGERNNFVDIDKTQFSFLLNNLVSNAIRHGITEAFPELQIKFFVRSNGKSIHLIVVNNGCPMDTSITFEKFVTPFFHFGRSGNSGLGGYIINTIIKNHNASFTLNSTIIGSDSFKTVFDFKFKESSKR